MPNPKKHFRPASRKRQAEMNVLPIEKQVQILNALVEGCSVRSTARLVSLQHESGTRITFCTPQVLQNTPKPPDDSGDGGGDRE